MDSPDAPKIHTTNGPDHTHPYYGILPYIATNRPITIMGTTFYSSIDTSSVPDQHRAPLNQLLNMFYIRDRHRITRMSYTYVELIENRPEPQIEALKRVHNLLAFLIGSAWPYETATFYLLREGTFRSHSSQWPGLGVTVEGDVPTSQSTSTYSETPCFTGIKNLDNRFKRSVGVMRDGRIFGDSDNTAGLSIVQDLVTIIQRSIEARDHWAIAQLIKTPSDVVRRDAFCKRIFRSLAWFNQSKSRNLENQEIRVVLLAMAFESLLGIDIGPAQSQDKGKNSAGTRTTEHFIGALLTLLGPVKNLREWAAQFYDARSSAVHRGFADSLHLRTQLDDNNRFAVGGLADIGETIYKLCINTTLAGHFAAKNYRLAGALVHVQEIIVKLIKVLKDPKSNTNEKWEKVKETGNLIQNYTINQIQENTTYEVVVLLLQLYLNLPTSHTDTARSSLEKLTQAAKTKDVNQSLAQDIQRLIHQSHGKPELIFTELEHAEAAGLAQILQWACHAIILFGDRRTHPAQQTQIND